MTSSLHSQLVPWVSIHSFTNKQIDRRKECSTNVRYGYRYDASGVIEEVTNYLPHTYKSIFSYLALCKRIENHLAKIMSAKRAFAVNSGMTALDVITRLVKAGEEVIAGNDLYGGKNPFYTSLHSSTLLYTPPLSCTIRFISLPSPLLLQLPCPHFNPPPST